jgi:hypothetical protein
MSIHRCHVRIQSAKQFPLTYEVGRILHYQETRNRMHNMENSTLHVTTRTELQIGRSNLITGSQESEPAESGIGSVLQIGALAEEQKHFEYMVVCSPTYLFPLSDLLVINQLTCTELFSRVSHFQYWSSVESKF